MLLITFLSFAAIDKNLAGMEVDIADLDVDELAHAHRRIEEQLEQDLVLHVTAVLDGAEEAFQIGIGKQLRQPALFASPAQAPSAKSSKASSFCG